MSFESGRTSTSNGYELRVFGGCPYIWTRVSPALYHIILLPRGLPAEELRTTAKEQFEANRLPTCLVLEEQRGFYYADGSETESDAPPRGGILIGGKLKLARIFAETQEQSERQAKLDAIMAATKERGGYLHGDLTKGGRKATDEELERLATPPSSTPVGLTRCPACGEYKGECLDPSPEFAGHVMLVHCRCENHNRCAACGNPLHERRLNANYFDERLGEIWHAPGFPSLSHVCPTVTSASAVSETEMSRSEPVQPDLVVATGHEDVGQDRRAVFVGTEGATEASRVRRMSHVKWAPLDEYLREEIDVELHRSRKGVVYAWEVPIGDALRVVADAVADDDDELEELRSGDRDPLDELLSPYLDLYWNSLPASVSTFSLLTVSDERAYMCFLGDEVEDIFTPAFLARFEPPSVRELHRAAVHALMGEELRDMSPLGYYPELPSQIVNHRPDLLTENDIADALWRHVDRYWDAGFEFGHFPGAADAKTAQERRRVFDAQFEKVYME